VRPLGPRRAEGDDEPLGARVQFAWHSKTLCGLETHFLGGAPIEEAYREKMNVLVRSSWPVVPPEAQRTPGRGGAG
jgi:hypothetical protein